MDSKVVAKIVSVVFGLAVSGPVALSDDSSLNDSKIESPEGEAILAIEKLVSENRKLREEVDEQKKVAANAISEAEVFKRQVTDLSHRMEALGASTATPTALEQKVLQAANALRHSETSKEELVSTLTRLVKILDGIAKDGDPEVKLVVAGEMKRVDDALTRAAVGGALGDGTAQSEEPATLLKGKVSAVKPDLDCVIINLGAKQGVKVGMPFRVKRGDKEVATIRVVDARQTFSGTVIQKKLSDKETVKLGDTITIDAQL